MSDIYEIAASGMSVQRTQMDLIAENLANAGVVRADGSIYHPKVAVAESSASFEPLLRDAALQPALRGQTLDNGEDDADFLVFSDELQQAPEPSGVTIARIAEQQLDPQYRFDPGSPFAAKKGSHKGYVALPDVDPIQQMIALVASGRAYDADVSMLQTAKQMDLEAADIDRA